MTLGNARTAFFNALLAQHQQGCLLLRIEDTDLSRSADEFVVGLQEDLRWLGIEWQEGPEAGGELGPYFQSQRQDLYDQYYQQLLDSGQAYPCFCSEEELALARKLQQKMHKPPRYTGTCRKLSAEDVTKRLEAGEPHTLRLHVPDDVTLNFVDGVKGEQVFYGRDIGDFIIRRADGTAPFMYSNVVDDVLMQVTYAVRGEDHLTNTPRQLMVLKALDLPAINYAHVALIVGNDGKPLSKRNGSVSIEHCRQQGFLASAIQNYLARLGHHYPGHDNDLLSFDQLAAGFELTQLSQAAGRFDEQQLLYWQKQAVQSLSADDFWQWVGAEIAEMVPDEQQAAFVALVQPNCVFPADVKRLAQALTQADNLSWEADQLASLQAAGEAFFVCALDAVDQDYAGWVAQIKAETGQGGKQLFMPLRLALTGQVDGPQLADIYHFLQASGLLVTRLQQAKDQVSG